MTKPAYYENPYAQELDARIISAEPKGALFLVEVDQTIFYPEGGGQPSDQGEIEGAKGKLKVDFVQYKDGRILHQGKLQGVLATGDAVRLRLKWGMRFHNMRVHSAGHLVHDALMSIATGLTPLKGSHGKKAFLQYSGAVDPSIAEPLWQKLSQLVAADLPLQTKESSYDEIVATCQFVPAGLPKNKTLRTLQIGSFSAMPDGGVHVKTTKEIGQVIIQEITCAEGVTTVKYRVAGSDSGE